VIPALALGFLGFLPVSPWISSGDIRALIVFGVPSSLAEGRAKTRTLAGTAFHKPEGIWQGYRGLRVGGRACFSLKNMSWVLGRRRV
jgi:hypothetical protein